MMKAGAGIFGINISVALGLAGIAGARMQTAAGIIRQLPRDCLGVIGVQELAVRPCQYQTRSVMQARCVIQAGCVVESAAVVH